MGFASQLAEAFDEYVSLAPQVPACGGNVVSGLPSEHSERSSERSGLAFKEELHVRLRRKDSLY